MRLLSTHWPPARWPRRGPRRHPNQTRRPSAAAPLRPRLPVLAGGRVYQVEYAEKNVARGFCSRSRGARRWRMAKAAPGARCPRPARLERRRGVHRVDDTTRGRRARAGRAAAPASRDFLPEAPTSGARRRPSRRAAPRPACARARRRAARPTARRSSSRFDVGSKGVAALQDGTEGAYDYGGRRRDGGRRAHGRPSRPGARRGFWRRRRRRRRGVRGGRRGRRRRRRRTTPSRRTSVAVLRPGDLRRAQSPSALNGRAPAT